MKSPALHRSALLRGLCAIVLTCLLVTQPLLGGGVPALAEPEVDNSGISMTLARTTKDELPTGAQNIYEITVDCSYLDGTNREKCLEGGKIAIDGVPEGWKWKIHDNNPAIDHVTSENVIVFKDIGTEGGTFTISFEVTPPNYTTPNKTSWNLTAVLTSESSSDVSSNTVTTTALATPSFTLSKYAVQRSSWVGNTVT